MFGLKRALPKDSSQMTVSQSMATIIKAGQDAAAKAADVWPSYIQKNSTDRANGRLHNEIPTRQNLNAN